MPRAQQTDPTRGNLVTLAALREFGALAEHRRLLHEWEAQLDVAAA
jgi:hypothetical protein